MPISDARRLEAVERIIRAEYGESPGLRLTERQFFRLFNVDPAVGHALLEALLARGFLKQTATGAYVRNEGDA